MSFGLPPSLNNPTKYTGDQVADIPGVNFPRAPNVNDVNYPLFTVWRNSNKSAVAPDAEGDLWILIKFNHNSGTSHLDAIWVKVCTGTIPASGGIISLDVDAHTSPGTDPVMPDVNGKVTVTGAQVAPSAIGANVIRSDSLAANTMTLEIQQSGSAATKDTTKNGVCHFNNSMFTVDQGFVSLAGGGLAIDQIAVDANTAPGTNPVVPDGTGQITITGAQVAAGTVGTHVIRTDSLAANTYTIEVQRSSAVAATDVTKNGVSHFDSNFFSVDTNAFVSAAGGAFVTKVNIDAHTAPGTSPVVADSTGHITVTGAQVASGTVGANVIRTDSLAANTYTIEIQRSTAVAATDSTKNGVSHFDSGIFSVDSSGFVSNASGGIANKIDVDAHTAPGTDPVIPDSTGKIIFTGAQVAAGTVGANVIRTDSLAANSCTIEIQRSTSNATTDSTKNGVAHFASPAFIVDSNGFVSAGSISSDCSCIGVRNIGIAYAASTFTVQSQNGTALSASNPGFITLQSKSNPGQLITITVTANQTFIDDSGASTITGNLFGFAGGDTIASNDIPFFLYGVVNDSENAISFMISRQAGRSLSPSSGNIGKTGSAVADTQFAFFALDNPTVTDYDTNPCLMIGSFRMRLTTAGGDWTVQTLNSQFDGIGRYQEENLFSFPAGILAASAGSYFWPVGGTAPIWSFQDYGYTISSNGRVDVGIQFSTNTTPGAGGTQTNLIMPFASNNGNSYSKLSGEYNISPGNTKTFLNGNIQSGSATAQLVYTNAGGSGNAPNSIFDGNSGPVLIQASYFPSTS